MTEVSFAKVKEVLGRARDLRGAEQERFLAEVCGDDAALLEEVRSLLAEADEAEGFLERPASLGELPRTVGGYRVLGLLGTGGMGAVYEAEQQHPRRRVALKMIRPGVLTPQLLRRFRRETELLGRLQHPGIAQIHDAGTLDLGLGEQPWFAMEFVDGEPLVEHARSRRLGTRARLALFVAVCDAVEHAHQRGVVHRDLKPDNILVKEASGSGTGTGAPTDALVGQPKVLDFGVARATDGQVQSLTLETSPGQLVGTLPYMSPEQVAGDPSAVGARSDVYALGVLLFELLADALPYDLASRSVPEAARVIREDEPRRLSSVDSRLRGDLDTIVAKALEKDPGRRYARAAELAADVRRYLADQPVLARPASTLYQLRKFAARHRALVGGVVVALVALTAGLVVSVRFALSEAEQRGLAEEREALARFETYRANLAVALASDDPLAARDALRSAPEEYRGWEHGYLTARALPLTHEHAPAGAAGGQAHAVAYPGGRALHAFVVDGALRLHDLHAGRTTTVDEAAGDVERLALSADGRRVAAGVAGVDGPRLRAWSTEPPFERLLDAPLAASCDGLALDPSGARVAWVAERQARWRALAGGAVSPPLPLSRQAPSLAWSRDGRLVAAAWQGGTWVVDGGGASREFPQASAVAWAPDSETLVLSGEGSFRVFGRDGTDRSRWGGWRDRAAAMAISSDGRLVASASADRISVWELADGDVVARFALRERGVPAGDALVFAPDDRSLLVRTDGGAVVLDLATRDALVLGDGTGFVYEAVFGPGGRLVASAGGGPLVHVWDGDTGEELGAWEADGKIIRFLAFSRDGTTLHAQAGRTLFAWDVARRLAGDVDAVRRLDPSSRWALAAPGARQTRDIQSEQWTVSSPDGTRLARGTRHGFEVLALDGTQRLGGGTRDADGDAAAETRAGRSAVAWSPDGTWVATGGSDGAVRRWDVATGALLDELGGHTATVYSLDVHPDGARLASAGRDGVVRLWDVAHGAELLVLPGHEDYVHSVRFSPDGTRLVTSSGDGTVRLWDSVPRLERRRAAGDGAQAGVEDSPGAGR